MAATELFENNPATTVAAGADGNPGNDTWIVASSGGFPVAVPSVSQFHVGDPAVPSEIILVTSAGGSVGTTWSVTRGAEGTTPVAHAAGFTVAQVVTAGWLGSVSFVNPMTTAGDMVAGTVSGVAVRVPGNTSSAKQFLTQTGAAGTANTPVWGTIATSDVPTLNQNTTGSAGTAASVSGTVTTAHGGTGLASLATYAVLTGGTSTTGPVQQVSGVGTSGYVLTSNGAGSLPTWQASTGGSVSFPITILEGGTGGTTAALAITNLGAADLTSAQTLTTKTLKNTSLTFSQLGTVATSQSLSCANGNVQELTLGTSVTISSISGPGGTAACDLTLYIKQAATGGPYTINSWPGSVTWLGGGAPTIQTGAGALTVVTFESLNGGTGWYGAQITGAPALPLDITLGGTGAIDSNDALNALAGEGVLSIFGNGNDGAIVFDGTTTYSGFSSLSGSTYTLTRDVQGAGITVNNGVVVTTSSATGTFRIFCQGIVTINSGGTISADGNAASGATAGAVLASGSLVGGRAGGAGGVSGTGQGGNGVNANMGVAGGTGGAAGGGGGTGGTAGTVTESGTNVVTNVFNTPFPLLTGICSYGGFTLQIGFGAGGSGGGGASGEAGGGGGGGGGIVAAFAYNVINNGTITAAGGIGGDGAGTGAGGGGGGAGGLIIAYTLSGWTEGTTNVAGGTGGTGPGSGANGAAGGAGTVVSVVLTS